MQPPNITRDPSRAVGLQVRVERRAGCLTTVAAAGFAAGTEVLFVDGDVVDRPDRYSVQIGMGEHVTAGRIGETDGSSGRHLWRFLNHSCRPNAQLRGRTLVASRDIAVGEDVTFDYEANEYEMAEPFFCSCGVPECRGWIRGWRFLSSAQRAVIASRAAPWLRAARTSAD
ncbi:MAG: SET domain-containing protein-lysine N-methyltransferase [Planctomycetes bacterium]|nr:SET domain-containing protein-lysine N-methyltransferase [Planctomycetota bacterium]